MSSRQTAAVAGVLLAALTAGSAGYLLWARQQPAAASSPTVAAVNGTALTTDDLEIRLAEVLPVASYHGRVEESRLLSLRRTALDDLILDELIYQEAFGEGRRARAAAVDEELAAVKGRFDSADAFAASLQENGISERELRERLARTVLVREAREAHAPQVVSDADVEAYYRNNATKFVRPEQVHLLEILVRVDPGDSKSEASAGRNARSILARLERGQAFDAIARAESQDEYRVKDGDMGFVHQGRLDAEFEAAVSAAAPGKFHLARALYGFQVFKVVERQPAVQLSLNEARPLILERLQRQRREDAERRWHKALLSQARVEILDVSLKNAKPAELPEAALRFRAKPRPATGGGNGQ